MKRLTKTLPGTLHSRIVRLILLCCLLCTALTIPALADMGPKPTVSVSFVYDRELWEKNHLSTYYVTLLAEETGTGPYDVNNSQEGSGIPEEIWNAFSDYKDPDGYHFLGYVEECTATDRFTWGYMPPKRFKVLAYFPEADAYMSSLEPVSRYAFDSYFIAREDLGGEPHFVLEQNYGFGLQVAGFLFRLALTILIEMLVALAFGYRNKKQLLIILAVNTVTQIILNGLLMTKGFQPGILYVIAYGAFELLVFLIEAVVYSLTLNCAADREPKVKLAFVYAAVANLLSFWGGYMISDHLRFLF